MLPQLVYQGEGKPQRRERTRFTRDCPAPPQGAGKPHPYYIRASQADSSYSRGDPCGRPGGGYFFSFCFSPCGARVARGRSSASKKDRVACVTASFIAWGAARWATGATTVCSGLSPAGGAMAVGAASASSWGLGGVADRFSAKNGVINASIAA